jgi:hypothetical protein
VLHPNQLKEAFAMSKSNPQIEPDAAQEDGDTTNFSPNATADLDPFDPVNLRLDQSFTETAGVKKLLLVVPVRRPNPQDFVRVHAGPDYRDTFAVVELRDEREIYLLTPAIARALPGEFTMVILYTAINRQGVLHLWPVKLPAPDGRRSAAEAAELAMRKWIRLRANMSLGAYDVFDAEGVIAEPEWPALSYREILKIAFGAGRLVDSLDHPLIKRLRGLV